MKMWQQWPVMNEVFIIFNQTEKEEEKIRRMQRCQMMAIAAAGLLLFSWL